MSQPLPQLRSVSAHRLPGTRLLRAMLGLLGLVAPIVLTCTVPLPARAQPARPLVPDSEQWQVIYLGQQRVGYGRVQVRNLQVDGEPIVRTTQESEMQLVRFGETVTIKLWLQINDTVSGEMRSFRMRFGDSPRRETVVSGRVDGGQLRVETRVAARTTSSRVDGWTSEVRSPAYELLLYHSRIREPGDRLRFKMYKPETNSIVGVYLRADSRRRVELHDGSERLLLRTTLSVPQLPTVRSYVDARGRVLKTETDFVGKTLTTYTVSRDVALQEIAGEELDQAVEALIRTNRIPRPHETKKVVYRVTLDDADPADLLPAGDSQTVESVDARTAIVTVRTVAPPRLKPIPRVADEYVDGNRFLQVEDPGVQRHARRAAGTETDPAEICFRSEKYVQEHLRLKNFSTALATAAEVAESLEGDCTEHAVLLAAMLRAKRIPTRLVAGVVYLERGTIPFFAAHMWTEANVGGRWIPLDATLGQRGIGAAHIKLSESSFADDAPIPATMFLPLLKILGKVQIQVVSVN